MSGDHTKYHGTAELPKREWVGLTDEEILDALGVLEAEDAVFRVARAVESKLKEKNA
jgi:hypothetical protein